MNPTEFKYLSALIIFVTTIIGNAMPLYITAVKWTSRLESLAGGVFLGAGLAHLLADSFEDLESQSKYPLGPAAALITFVILTCVELFSYGEHDEEFQVPDSTYDRIEDKASFDYTGTVEGVATIKLFGENNEQMTVPTYSLYIIMCIHSAIEGLALGILTTWSGVIAIFCAIVGHKPVEAFALSLIILKDHPSKCLFWFMVLTYTILTPCGVIGGIYLVKISSKLALGLIAAFSAGTFLFVGCHEWSEMFEHKQQWGVGEKLWHFGMFTLGVIWMLLIAIIEILNPED